MKIRNFRRVALAALAIAAGTFGYGAESGAYTDSMENRLEEGILLQEGMRDLNAAAQVFKEVVAAAGSAEELGAEAQFRLAECYAEQGNKALADAALEELLERFPSQSKWRAAAAERLPKEFTPEFTPWVDGERKRYRWTLPNDRALGYSVTTIVSFEREGRSLWRQSQRMMLNGHAVMAVEFDKETFRPERSLSHFSGKGSMECSYAPDGKSVHVEYSNGTRQDHSFESPVIDNENALAIMRQFPIEIGFATTRSLFVSQVGLAIPVRFEIVELLEVETPAGPFDCYKVELTIPGSKQYVYISADPRRILTRFEAGGLKGVLYEVDTARYDQDSVYRNEKYGYSVTHPDLWVVVEDFQPRGETASQQYFLDPDAKGGVLVFTDTNEKLSEAEREGPRALAKSSQSGQMENSGDAIDESYSREWEINGLPAFSYRVSGTFNDGQAKAIYVTVVMGESRHFIFQGHMPAGNFDEMQPQLDRLAASLRE